jgi:2-polyprenyl-6-methoxyphenol hydroxylase-like FAD-dependent oxidoreductase
MPGPVYDALIVGARCAGAATAMLLARRGARVLVVDAAEPGADTLSTHALMRGGVQQLARWGLLDRIAAAGTPPVRRTSFVYGAEEVAIDIRPGHGVDALYSPRRTVLDPILAAAAAEAGAEVRHRVAFRALAADARGRTAGAVLEAGGRTETVQARIVVGADGRRSAVARAVQAAVLRRGRDAAATVYGYFAGIADRGNRWHYATGAAAGVIPTNDGLHVVFAGLPPERRARGDLAAGLAAALAEVDPALAAEVGRGRLVGRPLAFAGEPGFLRQAFGPGWALVGDAGYFKDPITAHGITDALRDAELLAGALAADTPAALAAYQETRDALSLPLFRATDALAGFAWTLEEAKALHMHLHRAMKAEQDWIAGLATPLGRAA